MFLALMIRFLTPYWWVEACLTLVPTAKPVASDLTWMLLRSCPESTSVLPPSARARLDVGQRLPSGPLPVRKRSRVDARTPWPRAALRLFRSISARPRILFRAARVSPSSRIFTMSHIPFIVSRLKSRRLECMEKPAAAAAWGSLASVPRLTLPSATSVRNLMAAL